MAQAVKADEHNWQSSVEFKKYPFRHDAQTAVD